MNSINKNITEITSCEICGSKELVEVLSLGNYPLCDDLIKIGVSKQCEEYPIEIVFCDCCKTAHQKYQVSKEILFNDKYHYRAKATGVVLNGMKNLINDYFSHNAKSLRTRQPYTKTSISRN